MSNIFKIAQAIRPGNFSSAPSDASAGAIYWDTVAQALFVANGSSYTQIQAGSPSSVFLTNAFRLEDSSDPTKEISFVASSISTGQTRSITMPDSNVDLGNLTNSNISASAAIAYSKLALSNSILNSDINSSAAIAYSKLNLSGSIVNSDINSSAAIAYSKLNLSASVKASDINSQSSTNGYVLTSNGSGGASFAPASSGSVTSVAFSDASSSPIYSVSGSPVTSSGTLSITLQNQSANQVFAGPSSGSAAQPSFRALVANDIPSLSSLYVTQSEVGAASGVASLDSTGHIPLSQLPSSLVEYKGTWDASSNTPTLSNASGSYNVSGYFFIVSNAGSVNFGAGAISFNAGDWVLFNGSIWERAVQSNVVQSVNGQTGVVTVNAINQLTGDVTAGPASGSASAAATVAKIQGTTVSGTTGSGNVVFSASPTFSGTVSGVSANFSGSLSASNFSGSSSGTNTGDQTITLTGDVTGSGTGSFATTIASGAVSASKLGSVTDGITLDQSGSGSTLEVKTGGISNLQINSSAAIAYSKLNLSGSIINSDINASAAIAYSKLNLSGSILNADINSSAAIAYSKLASLSPNLVLVSNSSGFVSASSVTSTTLSYLDATSSIQTQLNTKLSSVSQDTSPTLGGDLNLNSHKVIGVLSREDASSPNSTEISTLYKETLTASTTAIVSDFTFDSRNFKKCEIKYLAYNGNNVRVGTLLIACDNASGTGSSNVSLIDQSTETAEINLLWSAAINGNNIQISYTTSSGTYSVKANQILTGA